MVQSETTCPRIEVRRVTCDTLVHTENDEPNDRISAQSQRQVVDNLPVATMMSHVNPRTSQPLEASRAMISEVVPVGGNQHQGQMAVYDAKPMTVGTSERHLPFG